MSKRAAHRSERRASVGLRRAAANATARDSGARLAARVCVLNNQAASLIIEPPLTRLGLEIRDSSRVGPRR